MAEYCTFAILEEYTRIYAKCQHYFYVANWNKQRSQIKTCELKTYKGAKAVGGGRENWRESGKTLSNARQLKLKIPTHRQQFYGRESVVVGRGRTSGGM